MQQQDAQQQQEIAVPYEVFARAKLAQSGRRDLLERRGPDQRISPQQQQDAWSQPQQQDEQEQQWADVHEAFARGHLAQSGRQGVQERRGSDQRISPQQQQDAWSQPQQQDEQEQQWADVHEAFARGHLAQSGRQGVQERRAAWQQTRQNSHGRDDEWGYEVTSSTPSSPVSSRATVSPDLSRGRQMQGQTVEQRRHEVLQGLLADQDRQQEWRERGRQDERGR
jgi:hypothetical protein